MVTLSIIVAYSKNFQILICSPFNLKSLHLLSKFHRVGKNEFENCHVNLKNLSPWPFSQGRYLPELNAAPLDILFFRQGDHKPGKHEKPGKLREFEKL